VLRPTNLSEYVKCFGLYHGTGTWIGNAEDVINTGLASLDKVIADREDIYEYLLEKGIDARSAYNIAEYVRKGLVNRRGWKPDMYKLLKDYDVPVWYIESCGKIQYLFPRGHAVALYSTFCKGSFELHG
jgi:DNA polymerase III alpha subunit (gram-positive type)